MVDLAQAKVENFLREGHANNECFHVAASAGPKLEAQGAIVTQPFTVHREETCNKQ
jgi:hypothetical protein